MPTTAPMAPRVDEGGAPAARVPASTYRLQLTAVFGFREAEALLPYLESLGVDALYLSPILAARPGSQHGYDLVDYGRISPELGGEEAFDALAAAAGRRGLGVLVDFVPNHMGIGAENGWWADVLENGPSSAHAACFDVDWRPVKAELANKLLVPVLGDQYGAILERGELRLVRDGGTFWLRYHGHRFPIAPRSVHELLGPELDGLVAEHGEAEPAVQELLSLVNALDKLAPREASSREAVAERAREKEVAKRRLAALCEASAPVRACVDRAVAAHQGRPGEPRSWDRLHALLEAQGYRLAYWRVAGEEINYRRFFDVNELAAVRMEEPAVFREAHRCVLERVARGLVTGLRIDHPDGLYDPTGYFRELQAAVAPAQPTPHAGPTRWPLYVVAEKILARGERMPDGWAVHGTTGYDFLNEVNGLFVDPAGAGPLEALRRRLAARRTGFKEEAAEAKRLVAATLMASELQMLAHRLNRTSETDRRTRDFTLAELRAALLEFVVELPIYRTYVSPAGEVDPRDVAYVEGALARARRSGATLDPSIFDFLQDVLLLRYPERLPAAARREWRELVLKLQQVTGPITAKAVEDTTFYRHLRLASLNEVGGDPAQFGVSPEAFHARCAERLARWPGSLLATSTHDTKRAEDARTRLDAISELASEWAELVRGWGRVNRRFARRVGGARAPDRTDEHLLYQALAATWPEGEGPGSPGWPGYVTRILAYLEKALRESKRHTSWLRVDAEYEAAARAFAEAVLGSSAFARSFEPVARRLAAAGRLSSLAQVALKGVAPGVADVYQGTELWDLSLVDPDNRRPVDFAARAALLAGMDARAAGGGPARAGLARELGGALTDGRAKLWLLATVLRARRRDPALFLEGAYLPLPAVGPRAGRVVAAARALGARGALCVVPRLALSCLEEADQPWQGELPLPGSLRGPWRDAVTGETHRGDALPLARLFADFPVAFLLSEA